jgi:hypothetical protein
MRESRLIRFLDACKYLVRSGADVDAVDYSGTSVSLQVYHKSSRRNSSFSGDLWDRVLAGAGFDVAPFRKLHGIQRRAWYNPWYTRRDFEAIWAGMTELCPYYYKIELPYDEVSYSTKSLFGFRSLWHQWGEDVEVGGFTERWRSRLLFRYDAPDEYDDSDSYMSEWSWVDSSDDSSIAESNGDKEQDSDGDMNQDGKGDGDGDSNIYDVSDQDSDGDNNNGDNEGDSNDDIDDGDSDGGGCRLE